ncbi:hypothetical protein BGX27_004503 [Mortierella sp. AM989]|nr:hypothetical protein BGX27_004503 [Mortierella sp. AM989]
MSGPSRSSSISPYRELPSSPSPSIADEGYDEQRIEIPKWVHQWTDEQRAELAIQLLKSVSPSVFTRSYARLTPLFEYRDFLVLLPYELTFHLLSFLDEKSLATIALVSKAWNKFASDNAVWRGLYLKRGWKVNHEMIDWYLQWAEQEEQWLLGPKGMHPRIHFEPESAVSNGKRKMLDHDLKNVSNCQYDAYDILQKNIDIESSYQHHHYDDDEQASHRHFDDLQNQHPLEQTPLYGHPEDVDMAPTPEDDYSSASTPVSIANSSPISYSASIPSGEPRTLDTNFIFGDYITFSATKVLWSPKSKLHGPNPSRFPANVTNYTLFAQPDE